MWLQPQKAGSAMTALLPERTASTTGEASDVTIAVQVGALLQRYFDEMARLRHRVPANDSQDLYGSIDRCPVFGGQLRRLMAENKVPRRKWVQKFCIGADECVDYTVAEHRSYASLHVNSLLSAA